MKALLTLALIGFVIWGSSYGGYGQINAYSYQNYYPAYYYSQPSYFQVQINSPVMPSYYRSYSPTYVNFNSNFGGSNYIYGKGSRPTFTFIDP